MVQADAGSSSKVAVVGGGIAGLAAAIHATKLGQRVTVFERSERPGGRARSEVEDGFILNLGPHALYADADEELAALGVTVEGNRPPTDGTAIYRGRKYLLPTGPGSIVRTGLLGPRQKLQTTRALLTITRTNPDTIAGQPLAVWFDSIARVGRLRDVLEMYFRLSTYANAPGELDAGAALRQFQLGMRGVRYLHGGWQRVVDGLREGARDAGVRVESGARVEAIGRDGDGFRLRLARGEEHLAGAVVLAVAPRVAASLLRDIAPAASLRALESAVSAEAACLDVGLSRLPRPEGDFTLGLDKPLYSRIHTLHADLAPVGMHLVSTAMYLPVGQKTDAEAARADLEALLDTIQPGWREYRVVSRFLPSVTVSEAIPLVGVGRPAIDGAGVDGVVFAGDWAGDESMLSGAALKSARGAAALAAAHAARRVPLAAAI